MTDIWIFDILQNKRIRMSKSNQDLLLMKYVNWNGAIYAFASGSLVGFGKAYCIESFKDL